MMFDHSAENLGRLSGLSFTGFADPVSGKAHQLRRIEREKRAAILAHLAFEYISRYGCFATGALDTINREVTILATPTEEFLLKLKALDKVSPEPTDRVNAAIELGRNPRIRVVVVADGDRTRIPSEYWHRFQFWCMRTPDPDELGVCFDGSFDAVLNLLTFEARVAAERENQRASPETIRTHFERIIDQAIADAELCLNPMLARAPTALHALTLKTAVYALLAREMVVPDSVLHIANSIAEAVPLDYFTDESRTHFRSDPDRDGYLQLIAEALLLAGVLLEKERPAQPFDLVQRHVQVVHYLEDIVVFLPRANAAFEKLLG